VPLKVKKMNFQKSISYLAKDSRLKDGEFMILLPDYRALVVSAIERPVAHSPRSSCSECGENSPTEKCRQFSNVLHKMCYFVNFINFSCVSYLNRMMDRISIKVS